MTTKENTNKNDSHQLGRYQLSDMIEVIARQRAGTATAEDTMLVLQNTELATVAAKILVKNHNNQLD